MTDYAFDNRTLPCHGTTCLLMTMLLITEHYLAMELLACSQTLPSTDYPTYKIHCMLFVSPLCQSCNHLMFRDWSVSVCKRWGVTHW